MTALIVLSLALVVALAAGATTAFFLARNVSTLRASLRTAEAEAAALRVENARLQERLEQTSAVQVRMEQQAREQFESMANKILMESAASLQRQNSLGIAGALQPVKENFENFRRTFAERTERDAAERVALAERIRDLMALNATIGQETRRLTDVLKGNSKVQGDWGEMILQTILERCGLQEGREFITQSSVNAEGGRLRPDVVINYTDGRKIVVDSKVSIQAYLRMVEADSDEHRRAFGKEHIVSVKKHIAELRDKNYQDYVGEARVEFVLMFIPHEGAYLSAMQLGGDDLWQTAYAANVLIVSPTHLMGVVRLVEQMWRQERQNQNAAEIARQAGAMLDKLRGFLEDMESIDRSLNAARDSWDNAFKKLSTGTGNLIGRAERLGKLGAKAKKGLPARFLPDEEASPAELEM